MQYQEPLVLNIYWLWNYQVNKQFQEFKYRYDPVPRIRNRSRRIGNFFKHPKTTQEKRMFYASPEYVRSKRKPINLPDMYDDLMPNIVKRSWKRTHKKRQWM